MSELVHVVDSAALSHALKAVRDGSSDWVLARHAEKKVDTIELVGHGLGGIEELNNHLKETDISFGLVRVVDRIDLSDTVKFVLIHYLGPSVGALFKGRAGVNTASLRKLFEPYHVAFENTEEKLTFDVILAKVQDASGSRSHVTEKTAGTQERGFTQTSKSHGVAGSAAHVPAAASPSSQASTAVPSPARQAAASVKVSPDVTSSIAALRAGSTDWVLASFPSPDDISEVVLVGAGTGGLASLKSHLSAAGYFYGLIRVVDVIDGHPTTKFAFITFVGNDVPPLKKAKISTFRATVTAAFEPYHVEVLASEKEELTEEDIAHRIGSASGSLSKVKE